jgi:hypothetical protein
MAQEKGLPLSLWYDPKAARGPMVTDSLVLQAEQRLGVKLPSGYIGALMECNGGLVRRDTLFLAEEIPGYDPGHIVLMTNLLGIGGEGGTDLLTPRLVAEEGYPAGCVVLDQDGDYSLLLDYRTIGPDGEPSVVLYFRESDEGERDEYLLAATFDQFIAGLVPDLALYDLGLTGAYTPDDLKAILAPFGTVTQRSYEGPIYVVDLAGIPGYYPEDCAKMLICYNNGMYYEYPELSVLVRVAIDPEHAWPVIERVREIVARQYGEQCRLICEPTAPRD